MKKILIALVFALMSIVANGQVKFGRVFASNHYYLKVGDYEFNTISFPASNKLVVERWFSIYANGLDADEIQNVCDYVAKNKTEIEEKLDIIIDEVVVKVYNNELYYTGDLMISRQKDCDALKARKEIEKANRLKSLNI